MGVGVGLGMILSSAITAAASTGQAVMARQAAKKQGAKQDEQQRRSEAAASSAARQEAIDNAQPDAPDPNAILEAEQGDAAKTMAKTRLSGAGGVDPNSLRLGVNALLGE